MLPKPKIQNIEPSRVVHELISQPLGTYIIRASTENDNILSQIKFKPPIKSRPYVVLSVRVNETQYPCPIMNYRLLLNENEDSTYLLKHYKENETNSEIDELPELKEEYFIKTEDTDWKIEKHLFQMQYTPMYPSKEGSDIICNFQDGSSEIKVFKKSMIKREQDFQREFSILKNLSYFHIISFYGICFESDGIKCLVFAHNGESLKTQYSNIKCPDGLMTKQLSMIGYQIACGMIYLEHKHIIHRDLHAGNILIDDKYFIRIADFGHAIVKDDTDRFQQSTKDSELSFQRRRLAPECLPSLSKNEEIIDSNESLLTKFSSKSDVWAYGLIFIELMIDENKDVYPDLPIIDTEDEEYIQFVHDVKLNQKIHEKLSDCSEDLDEEIKQYWEYIQFIRHVKLNRQIHEKPDKCPENLYNVLKRCWDYDPKDRISFMDIRNEMMKLFKSEGNEM